MARPGGAPRSTRDAFPRGARSAGSCRASNRAWIRCRGTGEGSAPVDPRPQCHARLFQDGERQRVQPPRMAGDSGDIVTIDAEFVTPFAAVPN